MDDYEAWKARKNAAQRNTRRAVAPEDMSELEILFEMNKVFICGAIGVILLIVALAVLTK